MENAAIFHLIQWQTLNVLLLCFPTKYPTSDSSAEPILIEPGHKFRGKFFNKRGRMIYTGLLLSPFLKQFDVELILSVGAM